MTDDPYRKWLLDNQTHGLDTYGTLLISLSGGALGLSFTFLRQIVGNSPSQSCLLACAWISWITSLVCILLSHYLSALAMEEAIRQHDRSEKVTGGRFDLVTRVLNAGSGLAFIAGAFLAVLFMIFNMGGS